MASTKQSIPRKANGLFMTFIFIILLNVGCWSISHEEPLTQVVAQQNLLTVEHGSEVSQAIERFEQKWLSQEAHLNPIIQSQVATGEELKFFGLSKDKLALEPYWLVTESATASDVIVLSYNSQRFKAFAHVTKQIYKTTPQGLITDSLKPYDYCSVYVFIKESNVWKLQAFLNLAQRRDYEQGGRFSWYGQILGDLPSETIEKGCP